MRHLPRQLDNSLGQARAVRDNHQTHSHLFLPSALHGAQKQSDRGRTWILVTSAALAQVAGAPLCRHQRDGGQHALLAGGRGGLQRVGNGPGQVLEPDGQVQVRAKPGLVEPFVDLKDLAA